MTGLAGLKNDPWLVKYLAETDRQNDFSPGTSAAIGLKESGLNPDAMNVNKDGTQDTGMFQINSSNMPVLTSEFRKVYGRDPDLKNSHDNAILQRMIFSRVGGSTKHRLGAYNAGPKNADGSVGQAYADDVLNKMLPQVQAAGIYGTQTPSSGAVGSTGKQTFDHNITVTLQDKEGKSLAPPASVTTKLGAAQAAGAN
jgi:hypothetical protein